MKRISLSIIAVLYVFSGLVAQTVDDALRYSQLFYGGTARFMSMGGAFTALGGDMSTLSQNPAGVGVFRTSEISVTPQLDYINSKAGFQGTTSTSDYLYNFNLSQAGFISNIMSSRNETGLVKVNFGYTFNKTNNLHQTTRIHGINNTSSMADYWAYNAEGTNFRDLTGPEGIAFDTWVIDTIAGYGGSAYKTALSKYGQTVNRLITNDGFTGEHAISFGGNYSNKVFFGATFGISQLRYVSQYMHSETISQNDYFSYSDYYEDRGTGYSFKLGAIVRPVESVRIGVAFHSPVWYHIDEYFFESMTSNFTNRGISSSSNEPMRFNYALTTPYRFLAGVAVQIKKVALLSADYEFVDYSKAQFSQTGDGYNYSEKNDNIQTNLKSASNFRAGGEYRINKFYLRAGYAYYGKPFRNDQENANLDYSSYSGGVGFRENNFTVDFGYTYLTSSQAYILYPVDPSVEKAKAYITTNHNMFNMTFAFRF
jgi:hypothetical protein